MTTFTPNPKRLLELSDSLPTALSDALDDFAAQTPAAGDLETVSSALSALGLPIALHSAAPLQLASGKLAGGVREIISASGPAASGPALTLGSVMAALGGGLASGAVVVALASVALPSGREGSARPQPSATPQRSVQGSSGSLPRAPLAPDAASGSPSGGVPGRARPAQNSNRAFDPSSLAPRRAAKPNAGESADPALPSYAGSAAAIEEESELVLLARAQRALVADPALALQLAAVHAQRFSASQLAQEREVIEVQGLVQLGRRAEAEARAAAFRRRYPHSAHVRRIDVVLGKRND